ESAFVAGFLVRGGGPGNPDIPGSVFLHPYALIPLTTTYHPDMRRMALTFSFSVGSVSSVSIKPAPEPSTQDDPSVNNVHGSGSSSSASMGVSGESSFGRSTMKSANIYPLTDVLGLCCMSYSPNLILHFCSLPATSGLGSTCLIGHD
ncbi:hypothetical protein Tco_1551424, partial [Tanacetum coccineum]